MAEEVDLLHAGQAMRFDAGEPFRISQNSHHLVMVRHIGRGHAQHVDQRWRLRGQRFKERCRVLQERLAERIKPRRRSGGR